MTRYEVNEELGRGAMGIVYRARQVDLKREVALKLLRTGMDSAKARQRFRREVQILMELSHANIIRLFDCGEMGEDIYFTMELLQARDLKSVLKEEGPFPAPRLSHVLLQLGDALAYCHERGVVHRDLKPQNVMVRDGDHVTLMDFGLARSDMRTLLTRAGDCVGTPRHLAPEVLSGQAATPAADMFSLGSTAYELATGQPAFQGGGDLKSLFRALLESDPAPIRDRVPEFPASLESLIFRLIAKDPARRPTARALHDELGGRAPDRRPGTRAGPAGASLAGHGGAPDDGSEPLPGRRDPRDRGGSAGRPGADVGSGVPGESVPGDPARCSGRGDGAGDRDAGPVPPRSTGRRDRSRRNRLSRRIRRWGIPLLASGIAAGLAGTIWHRTRVPVPAMSGAGPPPRSFPARDPPSRATFDEIHAAVVERLDVFHHRARVVRPPPAGGLLAVPRNVDNLGEVSPLVLEGLTFMVKLLDAGDRAGVGGPAWLDVYRVNGRLLGAIELCRGFDHPGPMSRYAGKIGQRAAYSGSDRFRLAAAKLIPAELRQMYVRSPESRASYARLLDEVEAELSRHDPGWARSPRGLVFRGSLFWDSAKSWLNSELQARNFDQEPALAPLMRSRRSLLELAGPILELDDASLLGHREGPGLLARMVETCAIILQNRDLYPSLQDASLECGPALGRRVDPSALTEEEHGRFERHVRLFRELAAGAGR